MFAKTKLKDLSMSPTAWMLTYALIWREAADAKSDTWIVMDSDARKFAARILSGEL